MIKVTDPTKTLIVSPAGTGVGRVTINGGEVENLVLLVEETRVRPDDGPDQVRYVTEKGQALRRVRFG
jgi:hypothetical protein